MILKPFKPFISPSVIYYPTIKFPITHETAERCLVNDLTGACNSIGRLIIVELNDSQYGALIDFVYNLGSGTLQRSTLRSKFNRGDYKSASKEFMRYIYAGTNKLPGLVRRRIAEQRLFLS